jgi:hypothetical protein
MLCSSSPACGWAPAIHPGRVMHACADCTTNNSNKGYALPLGAHKTGQSGNAAAHTAAHIQHPYKQIPRIVQKPQQKAPLQADICSAHTEVSTSMHKLFHCCSYHARGSHNTQRNRSSRPRGDRTRPIRLQISRYYSSLHQRQPTRVAARCCMHPYVLS